jgi:hypothetical protein
MGEKVIKVILGRALLAGAGGIGTVGYCQSGEDHPYSPATDSVLMLLHPEIYHAAIG